MVAQVLQFPSDAVTLKGGHPVTTSLKVAEVFNKRHRDVLRTVRELECSDEFRVRNFAHSSFVNTQGKEQPMFEVARDGLVFLVMGFTGPEASRRKEAYIHAFNQMEAALREEPPVAAQRTIEIDEVEFLRMRVELAELKLEKVQNEKRKRRAFTPAEKAMMLAMRAQGKGVSAIAERLGRSKNSIGSYLRQQQG